MVQGVGIVQSVFGGGIREMESVLEAMASQRPFNVDGAAPGIPRFGIERLDSVAEFLPGDAGFHLFQKLFLASFLAVLVLRYFSTPLSEKQF